MKNTWIKTAAAAVIAAASTGMIARMSWETRQLEVTSYRLSSRKLPEEFDGFKIVQITDLHQAVFGEHQEKLIAAVRKAQPDLIVITGDLVDHNRTWNHARDLLEGIKGLAPVYYVTGNHESRIVNPQPWLTEVRGYGVTVLRDHAVLLEKGDAKICLAGVDDPFMNGGVHSRKEDQEILEKALAPLNAEKKDLFSILLSHRPEHFELYSKAGWDLVLSGHTHGGQFRLPRIGALYAPYQGLFPRYASGLVRKGDTIGIIGRGLGCSHLNLRFLNLPELVTITLNHSAAE